MRNKSTIWKMDIQINNAIFNILIKQISISLKYIRIYVFSISGMSIYVNSNAILSFLYYRNTICKILNLTSPFQIDDWFCFITLEDLDTMITIFQLSYKRVF